MKNTKKKIPFFIIIFSLLSCLVLVAIASVLWVSMTQTQRFQNKVIEASMTQISQTIIERTTQYLIPAVIVAESSASFTQTGIMEFNQSDKLETYLFNQIKPYPQLSKVYVAEKDGAFTMVYRDKNQSLHTKFVSTQDATARIKKRDAYQQIISDTIEPTDYDARTRPWFTGAKQAGERYWTELYLFFTGKRPGITASYPMYDENNAFQGVFGVDVELSQLSEFLDQQKQEHFFDVFIINEKSQIVAQSGNVVFKTYSNGSVGPMPIDELEEPVVTAAYEQATTQSKTHFSMDIKTQTYFASYMPFPDHFGKSWYVMTVISKKDIQAMTNTSNSPYILIAMLIILAILVVTWTVTQLVKKPLMKLSFDIERLQFNNIESKPIQSRIKEISWLVQSYEGLKKQVSSSRYKLK